MFFCFFFIFFGPNLNSHFTHCVRETRIEVVAVIFDLCDNFYESAVFETFILFVSFMLVFQFCNLLLSKFTHPLSLS